jgi:hypothetical protein
MHTPLKSAHNTAQVHWQPIEAKNKNKNKSRGRPGVQQRVGGGTRNALQNKK